MTVCQRLTASGQSIRAMASSAHSAATLMSAGCRAPPLAYRRLRRGEFPLSSIGSAEALTGLGRRRDAERLYQVEHGLPAGRGIRPDLGRAAAILAYSMRESGMTGMRRARVLDEGFRLIQRLLLAKPAAGVNAARYGIPDGDWSQPPDLAGAQATPRSGDHPAEPGRHACSRFTLHGVPGPQRRQQKLPVGFRPRESCAGALPRRDVPNFCDFHITQTLRL